LTILVPGLALSAVGLVAAAAAHAGLPPMLTRAGGPSRSAPPLVRTLRSLATHHARVLWIATGLAAGWVIGGSVAGLIGSVGAAVATSIRRRRRAARAAGQLDDELSDAVRALASGIRAGLSLVQSLRYAADEAHDPLAPSLDRVVEAVDLGTPVDEAIERWAVQVGTDDARLVTGVLLLHRRSGGDLPGVLDQVAATLQERRAAAREVRALTAQARLSGAILGFLPIGFFGFLWLTSRRDIEGAFASTAGMASITVGLVLEGMAFLWIRRLLEVR
jgi:tight adherence protein B